MQTGLPLDTTRYYEKSGLIIPVDRYQDGSHNFTGKNIRQLLFAKKMRRAGVSVVALKQYVSLVIAGNDATIALLKEVLSTQAQRIEQEINELSATLILLQHKLAVYDTKARQSEQQFILDDD
ncbi:MerR family transcriptional regulator [Bombilactobacillus thymidiniphilus]|uniref:MerR family transcriptional regulator n=1 Tax=Bombilactobacillus thymidiniphilus TaxID=2923363 RepID=A0ABY4PD90_9LACO|nr:MerR family transcriptional regulator [Bombilactobacillus thymidiniphilus]UQS83648.1 MerR family transcriptional regulator [Bombilactobacillus thymidiniphilus]